MPLLIPSSVPIVWLLLLISWVLMGGRHLLASSSFLKIDPNQSCSSSAGPAAPSLGRILYTDLRSLVALSSSLCLEEMLRSGPPVLTPWYIVYGTEDLSDCMITRPLMLHDMLEEWDEAWLVKQWVTCIGRLPVGVHLSQSKWNGCYARGKVLNKWSMKMKCQMNKMNKDWLVMVKIVS